MPTPVPATEPTLFPAGPASPQSLAPPADWDAYRRRAARQILRTSEGESFTGAVPEPLRSIPVLQVQLNRDGSVRNIVVLRTPKFSPETIEMAKRAIRRAAPFEPVGMLPAPWQFTETFLYNEDLRFQLRSLVE